MKVKELMTRDPVTLGPDATCGEAATLMRQEDRGPIPIVDDARARSATKPLAIESGGPVAQR